MRALTEEDIYEQSGVTPDTLGSLENLEILFYSFEEIDSLSRCVNLRRISFIDNNIQRISNLKCLGTSLVSLCLCDQEIKKIENLDLPSLLELYLHRNKISKIEGLERCAHLKKLWLFQNDIKGDIGDGLYAAHELEVCWLQDNEITSCNGFENSFHLTVLGLAGNPITKYEELMKLSHLQNLTDLSLTDIHFTRWNPLLDEGSNIPDIEGYGLDMHISGSGLKEFTQCYLRQVQILDGIRLTPSSRQHALDKYVEVVSSYNSTLHLMESAYQKEINTLLSTQDKNLYGRGLLDAETKANLEEIDVLFQECLQVVVNQVRRQQHLLENNFAHLQSSIRGAAESTKEKLKANQAQLVSESGLRSELNEQIGMISRVETAVERALREYASQAEEEADAAYLQPRAYQRIDENSADFAHLGQLIKPENAINAATSIGILSIYKLISGSLCRNSTQNSKSSFSSEPTFLLLTETECALLLQAKSLPNKNFFSNLDHALANRHNVNGELDAFVLAVCRVQANNGRHPIVEGNQFTVEFLVTATSPAIEGGIKYLQRRLEMEVGRSCLVGGKRNAVQNLLNDFQSALDVEVDSYVDQLLEEVTAERAELLKYSSSEISARDAALRAVRAEIEKERKSQEATLRTLKK